MPTDDLVNLVASAGYEADRKAADEDRIIVLHQWEDGCLLTMYFDSQMPSFTANNESPAEMEVTIRKAITDSARVPAKDHPSDLEATGYVFASYEPTPDGRAIFNGKRYSQLDIIDYVLWTNDDEVRAKYQSVLADAKSNP